MQSKTDYEDTIMAMYVFEDEKRTKKLKVKDAIKRDKGIRYFCPNPRCNARMFLWNVEGEKKSYFRASSNPKHTDHCPYGSDNSYNPNNITEEGFVSDDVIERMMLEREKQQKHDNETNNQGNGIQGETFPHTIQQVYDMCKAYPCNNEFNGQTIGQILIDDRSIYMYPKGVFGYRLIEARSRKLLYKDTSIFLETPIGDMRYQLELKYKKPQLFKEIRELLYNNRNHVIVVAGKWESSGKFNCFATKFNSKKQIKVLKRVI
jgi:hypothetical protein